MVDGPVETFHGLWHSAFVGATREGRKTILRAAGSDALRPRMVEGKKGGLTVGAAVRAKARFESVRAFTTPQRIDRRRRQDGCCRWRAEL
jgi:hypothetical protein